MNVKKFATLFCCAVFAISSVSFAQEQEVAKQDNVKSQVAKTATLNEEGELVGKVFAKVDGEETPLAAKLTLSKDGVVIKTVEADENGLFAFASIAPGTYNMFGSAASYYGGSTISVEPYSGTAVPMSMGLSQGVGYDSFGGAPAMGCSTCGGGSGFGGGGSGILGNRRLRRLALIGGIVAIAIGDASPDED